jgi:hypothetical protein
LRQVGKLARDQPAECAHLKMTAMKGVSQSATCRQCSGCGAVVMCVGWAETLAAPCGPTKTQLAGTYQGIHKGGEAGTNNNCHRQVDDIAAQNEVPEACKGAWQRRHFKMLPETPAPQPPTRRRCTSRPRAWPSVISRCDGCDMQDSPAQTPDAQP